MRKTLSLLAAAATVAGPALVTTALPTVASAQGAPYLSNPCGTTQRNHRVVGGGIGAVAGYYLGGKVAADNARDEGRILGALAGAAAGQEVGRRTGCQAAFRQVQNRSYAYQPGYARPSCKAIAGGRSVCLQPDGRWR